MQAFSPSPLQFIIITKKPYYSYSANPKLWKIRSSAPILTVEKDSSEEFPAIKVAKRVVLVRHGQSTWNAEGRIQGSSNFSVLTPKGEAQAETSRQMLLDDSFDVCFTSGSSMPFLTQFSPWVIRKQPLCAANTRVRLRTSYPFTPQFAGAIEALGPLSRSKRTAEIIWGTRDAPMIPDTDLREIDLYSFQGLLKHEGKEKFGPAFRQWQVDAPNFVIDDHYPVRELWARARSCWDRILAHQSKSVLVVAHNAVNQALVATAIGLGTEYFRVLLQSNCGVSVLDFISRPEDRSPYICLNRLNQTPGSPIAGGTSGGRKASSRIILACHGTSENSGEVGDQPMNMLGVIQSQKTAELLLDLKVNTVVSSPRKASAETAKIISQVQEAADCLGADCVPRYVDVKEMDQLSVETFLGQSKQNSATDSNIGSSLNGLGDGVIDPLWDQTGNAWQSLIKELSNSSEQEQVVVAVGHPILHIALMTHCLNLTQDWLGSFHLDEGSISVIDFPDEATGKGIIRCINYTAHLGRWSIPITKSTLEDEEY